jgi:hypothetical protein
MIDFDREEDDCLKICMESYTLLLLLQLAFTRGLKESRVRVHACKPYAGRVYLCGSRKHTVKQINRDSWYGRPESLLAQTLQKLQKTGKQTSLLKIPKNIPRNPRDFPSMVSNYVVVGNTPTD